MSALDGIHFDERGLVPVIAQDVHSGEVLTLAYASREAVEKTLYHGEAHYYSRSRAGIWRKGETSGNTQRVLEVRMDCDGDALLYRVDPAGPACHTGERTCFFSTLAGEGVGLAPAQHSNESAGEMIDRLSGTIARRHREMPEGSYTAQLLRDGTGRVSQKLGEEAVETVVAALEGERVAEESADLVYHLLVLLEETGTGIEEVGRVLRERHR